MLVKLLNRLDCFGGLGIKRSTVVFSKVFSIRIHLTNVRHKDYYVLCYKIKGLNTINYPEMQKSIYSLEKIGGKDRNIWTMSFEIITPLLYPASTLRMKLR